jgi:hypothetical protein
MPASSPLRGHGLLTPLQRRFLALFSQVPDQEQFYLSGGTALAEYYLGHRLSYDLDLFTGVNGLVLPMSYQIERMSKDLRFRLAVVRRFSTYVEFLVSQDQDSLRVDLALDSPFRLGSPLLSLDGVFVNDYEDLRVDKLLAYYGRAEPRDAVDLYFILRREPWRPLLTQAAQKDPGFDLYWFAVALNRCTTFPDELERWPVNMLVPFNPAHAKATFQELAWEIMDDLTRK